MMKRFFYLLLASSLVLGQSGVVWAWQNPTAGPPGGNLPAPLNTSATGQTKTGGLTLGGLTVDINTLYVDTTNDRVGIGTTGPLDLLHVQGSVNPGIRIFQTGGSNPWVLRTDASAFHIRDAGNGFNVVRLDGGGGFHVFKDATTEVLTIPNASANVGIGTTGPGEKLDVVGTIQTQGATAGSNRVVLKDTSASPRTWEWYPQAAGANTLSLFERVAVITPLTIVSPSGNVGIGTAGPGAKLEVAGDILFGATTNTGRIKSDGTHTFVDAIPAGGAVITRTGGAVEAMRVTSAGNVGIGTAGPGQKLSVAGTVESTSGGFKFPDATVQTTAAVAGLGGGGTVNYVGKFTGTGTIGNSQIFDNGTNVGIGTAGPGQKLQVEGNIQGHRIKFPGVGGDSGVGADYYAIYQESGAWVSPYPDLRVQYHTGIKYDAYFGYGGHQFYTGYDGTGNPAGLQMQITDKVYIVGNVGIGTAAPSTNLHVVGNTRISGLVSCNTIDTDASGNLVCGTDADTNSGGTVTSISAGTGISLSPNPITLTGTITNIGDTNLADEHPDRAWLSRKKDTTACNVCPAVTAPTCPTGWTLYSQVDGGCVSTAETCGLDDRWRIFSRSWDDVCYKTF